MVAAAARHRAMRAMRAGTGHIWCLVRLPFVSSRIRKVKEVQGKLQGSISLIRAMFLFLSTNEICLGHLLFILRVYLFSFMYVNVLSSYMSVFGACRGQKSTPGPLELELQMTESHHVGAWELNLGLLQEQQVLLTSEPQLQPLPFIFCLPLLLFMF